MCFDYNAEHNKSYSGCFAHRGDEETICYESQGKGKYLGELKLKTLINSAWSLYQKVRISFLWLWVDRGKVYRESLIHYKKDATKYDEYIKTEQFDLEKYKWSMR